MAKIRLSFFLRQMYDPYLKEDDDVLQGTFTNKVTGEEFLFQTRQYSDGMTLLFLAGDDADFSCGNKFRRFLEEDYFGKPCGFYNDATIIESYMPQFSANPKVMLQVFGWGVPNACDKKAGEILENKAMEDLFYL